MDSPQQLPSRDLAEAVNEVLRRQSAIEERLERLERVLAPPPEKPPMVKPAFVAEPQPPVAPSLPQIEPLPSDRVDRGFESKVGLTLVNRVGVVTLVLGVAFFFKWAVDNDWISQTGRVILGLLAGFAALALADYLWRKSQQIFANGITGTGIAVLYLSIYAAFNYYHLFPQSIAMVLMIAVTALSALLALRYDSVAIAALGMVGGYLSPLLLSTGQDHPWFLFSYLLLLNIAATDLASKRKWPLLEVIGFTATVLIYALWLSEKGHTVDNRLIATLAPLALCAHRWRTTLPVLFAIGQFLTALAVSIVWAQSSANPFFALALFVAGGGLAFSILRSYPIALSAAFSGFWLSYLVWSAGTRNALPTFAGLTLGALLFYGFSLWRALDKAVAPTVLSMTILALDGPVYFAAAYALLHAEYYGMGLLAVAIAVAYAAFGAFLHHKLQAETVNELPVLVAFGVSLCFFVLAIPIQFTGFTVTICWAIQAAAVTWIGARLNSRRTILAGASLFVLPILRIAVLDSWLLPHPHSYTTLVNLRFFTLAAAAASLFFGARAAVRIVAKIALAEYLAGHIVLLWALTLEVIGWAKRSTQLENQLSVETVTISVIFGLYAVALVSTGVATRTVVNRVSGLVLMSFVILKLYFFDVWQLGRIYQISAFVALGILLLSTSFLYSHFRRIVEGWWKT